jgi:hypothetical protein
MRLVQEGIDGKTNQVSFKVFEVQKEKSTAECKAFLQPILFSGMEDVQGQIRLFIEVYIRIINKTFSSAT